MAASGQQQQPSSFETLFRRHRHRRDPDPDPQGDADARRRQLELEQEQNKFKPQFSSCEDYRPEVEEESSRGRNS